MIQRFVDRFMERRDDIRATFKAKHPDDYVDIVRTVVEHITDEEDWRDPEPDPGRIHSIDDGDYRGTLVFVVAAKGYQPSTYWYVRVAYGSCSGCDTLKAINGYSGDDPTDEQANDYLTLALHVVQGLRQMDGDKA